MKKVIGILTFIAVAGAAYYFTQEDKTIVSNESHKNEPNQKTSIAKSSSKLSSESIPKITNKENTEKSEKPELDKKLESALSLNTQDKEISKFLEMMSKTKKFKSDEEKERFNKIAEVMAEFGIFQKIQNELEKSLTDMEKENLIEFYNSELTVKLKENNQNNLKDPEYAKNIQKYISDFKEDSVDQEKLALVKEINDKGSVSKVQLEQSKVMSAAMTKAMLMASMTDKSEQEIDKMVEGTIQSVETQFNKGFFPAYYYGMSALTKEELKDYRDLYARHPQELYADKMIEASRKVMAELGKKIGEAL